jgi:hypothetical protein
MPQAETLGRTAPQLSALDLVRQRASKNPCKSRVGLVRAANACHARALAGRLDIRTLFARRAGFQLR